MKKLLSAIGIIFGIAILAQIAGVSFAAPYPTALGGLGTSVTPASGTIPIGNGAGSYTPAVLTPGTDIIISNASGSVTIAVKTSDFLPSSTVYVATVNGQSGAITLTSSTLGVATNTISLFNGNGFATTTIQSVLNSLSATGLLTYNSSTGAFGYTSSSLALGSASHYNFSDFLPSSTVYVATVNGQSGAVTIGVPATTTINSAQASTFKLIGDGTTVTSTVNGTTTTFSIINTGNWAGTWQGANSTTFYLASNPSGFISHAPATTTINGAVGSAFTFTASSTGNNLSITTSSNGIVNFLLQLSSYLTNALQSLNGATSSNQTVVAGNGVSVSTTAGVTNSTTTVTNTGVLSVQSSSQISVSGGTGSNLQFSLLSNYLTAALTTLNGFTNATETVNTSGLLTLTTSSPNVTTIGFTSSTLNLGSASNHPASDFLASSTTYVSSVNGSSGVVTITSSSLGVTPGGGGSGGVSTSSPTTGFAYFVNGSQISGTSSYVSSFNGATGTISYAPSTTIPTNTNQLTNGAGFITTTTIPNPLVIGGSVTSTIYGSASGTYIANFNQVYQFPSPSYLSSFGCMGNPTIMDPTSCLQYIYSIAPGNSEIDIGAYTYTTSASTTFNIANKYILIKGVPGGGTVFNSSFAASGQCWLTFDIGNAKETGWGINGIYASGPNSGTSLGICYGGSQGAEGGQFDNSLINHFYRNLTVGDNTYLWYMEGSVSEFNATNNVGGGLIYVNGSTNTGETIEANGSLFADGQPAANAIEIQTSGETNVAFVGGSSDDAQAFDNQYGGQGNNVLFDNWHCENPAAWNGSIPSYDCFTMNSGNPFMNDTLSIVNSTIQNDAGTYTVPDIASINGHLVLSNDSINDNGLNGYGVYPVVVNLQTTSSTIYSEGITQNTNNYNGIAATYLYNTIPLQGGVQTYNVTSTLATLQVLGSLTDANGNKYVTSTISGLTTGYIPFATSSNALSNSIIFQLNNVSTTVLTPTSTISFDNSAGSFASSVTSSTISYTTSGTNRILFVAITGDLTSDKITGVTYAGVSMTRLGAVQTPGDRWTYLYSLENPASGTNNIVVSASGSTNIATAIASYDGVAQTGQPEAINSNTATSVTTVTATTTSISANDWILVGVDGASGMTGNTTSTNREANGSLNIYDTSSSLATPGTYGIKLSGSSSGWGWVAVALAPNPAVTTSTVTSFIGVGTSTPSSTLTVAGTFQVSNTSTFQGNVLLPNLPTSSFAFINSSGQLTTTSTPSGGSSTVGPSTSTLVAVFNTSGTIVGYAPFSYASTSATLYLPNENVSGTLTLATSTASGTIAYSSLVDSSGFQELNVSGNTPASGALSTQEYNIVEQNCPNNASTSNTSECDWSMSTNYPDGSRVYTDLDQEDYGGPGNLYSGWFETDTDVSSTDTHGLYPIDIEMSSKGSGTTLAHHLLFQITPVAPTGTWAGATFTQNGAGTINGNEQVNGLLQASSTGTETVRISRGGNTSYGLLVFNTNGTDDWNFGENNNSTNNFVIQDATNGGTLLQGIQNGTTTIGVSGTGKSVVSSVALVASTTLTVNQTTTDLGDVTINTTNPASTANVDFSAGDASSSMNVPFTVFHKTGSASSSLTGFGITWIMHTISVPSVGQTRLAPPVID